MIETLFPPVPEDDGVERAARERGLAAVREASIPARRRRPRIRWWLLPTMAAVAAGVFALVSGVDEGRVSPPAASAAQLLARAAVAAERAPAPGALGPGEYLYVRRTAMEPKRITFGGERFTVFLRYVDEDWTARDGSGRSRHRPVGPAFPTARDRAAWERAGSPSQRRMVGNYLPILGGTDHVTPAQPRRAFPARSVWAMSYRQVRALPTDPVALERRLRAGLEPDREIAPESRDLLTRLRLLEWIGSLLAGAPLEAAQRAALFHVAAGIEGVTVSHDALDQLGRRGTAVKLEGTVALNGELRDAYRGVQARRGAVLVFDPGTGALLGTRHTVGEDADFGAVYTAHVRDALK